MCAIRIVLIICHLAYWNCSIGVSATAAMRSTIVISPLRWAYYLCTLIDRFQTLELIVCWLVFFSCLQQQVNYKTHMNIRRMNDRKHHKRSKRASSKVSSMTTKHPPFRTCSNITRGCVYYIMNTSTGKCKQTARVVPRIATATERFG